MSNDVETFEIPAGIEEEVKVAADVLRDALTQRLGEEVDVGVIEDNSRGFLGEAGWPCSTFPPRRLRSSPRSGSRNASGRS